MAIKITEDGTVRYVNENDVDRTMFPNLTGAMGDEQYDALNGRLVVVEGKISDLEECCGDVNNEITGLKNDFTDLSEKVDSAFVTETATGSIASFSDGADDVPVKDLTVAIEPVQSGSGDPSPENIRPISGWTGANVYHSGEDTSDYDTLSISWETEAGTVYGGTLDVTTGVLTVDRAVITMDGTQSIGNNGALSYGGIQVVTTPSPVKKLGATNAEGLLSDKFKIADIAEPYTLVGRTSNANLVFNMPTDVTSIELAKTWFTNNPTQVSYLLATPQTYQLTPQEVKTVLGQNNIFADTGNVTVQYRADTKLYIDKVLSA